MNHLAERERGRNKRGGKKKKKKKKKKKDKKKKKELSPESNLGPLILSDSGRYAYNTLKGLGRTLIYRQDLTDIFNNHIAEDPLFLYLPLHNVHAPNEAPKEWLNLYPENSTCKFRRTYQAMVSVADNITGHVVEFLKKKNMWNNSIVVVSADNGGAPCQGSNYPLKGSKMTFFEGGVRALAFASGGLIPDWYATFCNLAGVDPSDSGEGKFPVDSLDIWPIITGSSTTSPHDEIVLGYDFNNVGAIISGNYKLIVGPQPSKCDSLMWTPLDYPCNDGPKGGNCNSNCLYDIVNDPSEKNDLAETEPDILKRMLEKYNAYSKEPRSMQDQGYHTSGEVPIFKDACKYMAENGGYWRPWKKDSQ